jgi:hypothetical protein
MLKFWHEIAMLSFEAQRVVALRTIKLARGGKRARAEASRMAAEKLAEGWGLAAALSRGRPPAKALKKIRRRVRGNARRLSRR